MDVNRFLYDPQYKIVNIWNLKYISTSDEEDNDSASEEEEDEEGEENENENGEEEKKEKVPKKKKDENKIWMDDPPGKNENVP